MDKKILPNLLIREYRIPLSAPRCRNRQYLCGVYYIIITLTRLFRRRKADGRRIGHICRRERVCPRGTRRPPFSSS